MKQILFITFSFFTLISFGQQTYKINEGELQFICNGKGIIIKKENQLYELKINPTFNKQKQEIKTQLLPITDEKVKSYKEKNKIITYDEINENYDFEKLKKLSFNYIEKFGPEDKDYEEYKLCQINNNFFAMFRDSHEDKNIYTTIQDYMPYIFIEFNSKKIIYTYDNEELFIIPTKKNVQILSLYDNYNVDYKTQKLKLSNSEIYQFTKHSFPDLDDDFFLIDTIPNKKLQLKNIYNETIINQSYDSIILSPIIKCYNNRKIDLYNLTYKKLNKTPLKAVKGNLGSIQILEKNKVNWIDWTGKK